MIPEAEDKTLREIIVQGYRTMYRLEADRVLVLAVMHGAAMSAGWRPSLGMKARLGIFILSLISSNSARLCMRYGHVSLKSLEVEV